MFLSLPPLLNDCHALLLDMELQEMACFSRLVITDKSSPGMADISSVEYAWLCIFESGIKLHAEQEICEVYADMIAERRKRVTNGVEDTFGMTKSQ
ncbi:hypothetical protein D5086_011354 [Populus alba]|uniref:Uncharacterized protein n=1 Tax=Populus alba TaxID=43335 RepID=A0ACC4CCS1_POPAL